MSLPLVDVVIPVYNRSNLVLRLVDSLRGQYRLGQVVIVDDFSQDSDRVVLETIKDVKLLHNRGNSGFITSVNRGVKHTESDYILILNSDTEAYHPHCIEYMAENLDDGAAVVGALLIYPKEDQYRAEAIQHAGIFFNVQGYPVHILAGFPADEPAATVKRIVPAVTGACLMTTRRWWEKIGGFDDKLSPGCFEDVSYCIQVGRLGGEIIYEPRSIWYHAEHSSQGQNGNWFTPEHLGRNFQYLMTKHGKQSPSDSIWFKGVQ